MICVLRSLFYHRKPGHLAELFVEAAEASTMLTIVQPQQGGLQCVAPPPLWPMRWQNMKAFKFLQEEMRHSNPKMALQSNSFL